MEGGFVKPTDDSDEGSVKEVQTETSNNFQNESIEGGFVKPTDDSQRE